MHHILLIEDDIRMSELIKKSLNQAGYHVIVEHDGYSGEKLALEGNFDLLITDILLPRRSGLLLSEKVKSLKPHLPIIMLTALGTTDEKVEGFDAGADDYLVKPFEIRELLARINVLIKRYSLPKDPITQKLTIGDLEMNLDTKSITRKGKEINLTPKEFKLLEYLIQNKNRVISKSEIAEKVWETHFDTGTNFIDVYISYLRNKIDKGFDHKIIHTKTGMGYMLKW